MTYAEAQEIRRLLVHSKHVDRTDDHYLQDDLERAIAQVVGLESEEDALARLDAEG